MLCSVSAPTSTGPSIGRHVRLPYVHYDPRHVNADPDEVLNPTFFVAISNANTLLAFFPLFNSPDSGTCRLRSPASLVEATATTSFAPHGRPTVSRTWCVVAIPLLPRFPVMWPPAVSEHVQRALGGCMVLGSLMRTFGRRGCWLHREAFRICGQEG